VTIIFFSIISVNLTQPSKADTGTSFSGVISSDTTWTEANSPYKITGNVLVNNGVTLTIEPGVTVNFETSYYTITVDGTLTACGTSDKPITFNSGKIAFTQYSSPWDSSSSTGCIISNANISVEVTFLTITSASPNISNCIINTTAIGTLAELIKVDGGAPTIRNNSISATISGTALSLSNSHSLISDNLIFSRYDGQIGTEPGKGIVGYGDFSTIQRNLIINCSYAILLSSSGSGGCLIQNNTLTKNTIGIAIRGSPNPNIVYNNIESNQQYSMSYEYWSGMPVSNIDVPNNWWGATDTQTINQTIYDYKNDFNVGKLNFAPFLTLANSKAPTFINASTSGHGAIYPNGITKLENGHNQTFTIKADNGYYIADLFVNGTSVGSYSIITISKITAPTSLYATFASSPIVTGPITVQFDNRVNGTSSFTSENIHTSAASIKLVMPQNASESSMAIALYPYNHLLVSVGTFSAYASYTTATPRFMIYLDKDGDNITDSILVSDYQSASDGSWHLTAGGTEWGWVEANTNLSWNNTWQSLDYWKGRYRDSTVVYLGVALDYWSPNTYGGFGLPVFVDELVLNGVTYNIAQPVEPTPTPTVTPAPTYSSSSSSSGSSHTSSTSTPTPTPTVPELSFFIMLPMLAAVLFTAILKHRISRRPTMRSF
jgi:parallel beta-helix repeat protein